MSKSFYQLLTITILLPMLTLLSCSTAPHNSLAPSANEWLQKASHATGQDKAVYLLQAANQYLDEQKAQQADAVLKQANHYASIDSLILNRLITARLLIAKNQNNTALNLLYEMDDSDPSWTLSNQMTWHTLLAEANQKLGHINNSIEQYQRIIDLLPKNKRKAYLLSIWRLLENTSQAQIETCLAQTTHPIVKAWLLLAMITKDHSHSSIQSLEKLQSWALEYPHHPALSLLSFPPQAAHFKASPQSIAVMLPLTGAYQNEGNAIRRGLLTAYYYAKQQGKAVPNIIIMNTDQQNIINTYKEALHKGADFVIGPLIKSNLMNLVQSGHLNIPTLALNSLPQISRPNLYQFSLSPLDEIPDITQTAWNHHHHNALILYPNNPWGVSIANKFQKHWEQVGGQLIDSLAYSQQKELSPMIRHLLRIDESESNYARLEQLLGKHIRFIPRRRQDIDIIFLVATPDMARQIHPLLEYFYAGNIPIYATSTLYASQPNRNDYHDMNGIRFPDMPWVLSTHLIPEELNFIRQQARQAWPQSFNAYSKLFALGIDAYQLVSQLSTMTLFPELNIPAATGRLSLKQNHQIHRRLCWAKIINGTPTLLSEHC